MISKVWSTFPGMAHTLLFIHSERPGMNEQITKGAKYSKNAALSWGREQAGKPDGMNET